MEDCRDRGGSGAALQKVLSGGRNHEREKKLQGTKRKRETVLRGLGVPHEGEKSQRRKQERNTSSWKTCSGGTFKRKA